jgi:uncharacterized protein YigE (DUF2233 family)
MKWTKKITRLILLNLSLFLVVVVSCRKDAPRFPDGDDFENFTVETKSVELDFFWKDEQGEIFKSIGSVKSYVEKKGKRLRFAMNGGMFEKDKSPTGLFIQNQIVLKNLDTGDGSGNFYVKPNGIFYITNENEAFVTPTENFRSDGNVKFATQSGPMLLIEGKINAIFEPNSANLHYRNGVGILPDGKVMFAISQKEVSFYDFALYFKNSGCRNALYLDGFVSRMYLPEKNIEQLDGEFGVIIGVTE